MRIPRMVMSGTLVVLAAGGCTADLDRQNALLTEENEDLRQQLADRNAALAGNQDELRERNIQIAELRRDMETNRAVPPSAQVTGFEEIADVSASFGSGEIVVEVASDVLFASGKATLKSAAKVSLDDVASVLNRSYSDQLIRIEGYTDTDPIRKSGHASNYHLGFERAYAVREYLASRGVEPARMSLASYGPHAPRSTKSESRRVEIVVLMQE